MLLPEYGLAGVTKHLPFYCLPKYMNAPLCDKYKFWPTGNVLKGYFNLLVPMNYRLSYWPVIITDCAPISIAALLEARKKINKKREKNR